jgi:MoaA/NifB/PqqE/SkfB family radical SAM enzyme
MSEMTFDSKEYLERLALSVQAGQAMVTPLTASLHATKRCNSRCQYCGIWKARPTNPSLEDLLLAVDELAAVGIKMISLTGGEPFMQPHLPQVVKRMYQHGLISSTMTNGTLLNPRHVVPLLEAGLTSLCVSLDTVDPATYERIRGMPLAPVLKGLRYVAGIRRDFPTLLVFSVSCVISRINVDQLAALVEFCGELGITIGFQPLHKSFESEYNPEDFRFSEEDLPNLETQIDNLLELGQLTHIINNDAAYLQGFPGYLVHRKLPPATACTAGFTTIAIDADLNVKSCWPKRPVGNLRTERLADLWWSDRYNEQRLSMLKLECPGCWLRCHTDHWSVQWLEDLLRRAEAVRQRSAA